jgi:hypothetical protein
VSLTGEQAAIVVLAVLVFGFAVAWWLARTRIRRGNARRFRVAQRGEAGAEDLLRRAGYVVVERQRTERFVLEVDGAAVDAHCRADLLVRDADGADWVAEVKTGERAPNPARPQTRRQLLEYALLFDVVGVLLVDMEAREIHTVRFPFLDR